MGRMHKSFMTRAAGVAVAIWTGGAVGIAAQEQGEVAVRAIPAAVDYSPEFERALQRGWRSAVGAPGHSYWQTGQGTRLKLVLILRPLSWKAPRRFFMRMMHPQI